MLRELQRCVKSGVAGWPECVTGLAVAVRVLLIVRLVLLWSFGSVILAASELWAVVATVDGIAGGEFGVPMGRRRHFQFGSVTGRSLVIPGRVGLVISSRGSLLALRMMTIWRMRSSSTGKMWMRELRFCDVPVS